MTSKAKKLEKLPTTTASQIRTRIYQATRRPVHLTSSIILTNFGVVSVTGRLGQVHCDVMESICYCAEGLVVMEDGRYKLLVDLFNVRNNARVGGEMLHRMIVELMSAVVEVRKSTSITDCIRMGHLIDFAGHATNSRGEVLTRKNPLGGLRPLWRVELGKASTDLFDFDKIKLHYDPYDIAQMRHGVSQAVIRHALTHSVIPHGGWFINTLIESVCGPISKQKLKNRRSELRDDASNFVKLGFRIVGEKFRKIDLVEQMPDLVEQLPDLVE